MNTEKQAKKDIKVQEKNPASPSKKELDFGELHDVAGGSQVETRNEVINNNKNVKIGPTVVINM